MARRVANLLLVSVAGLGCVGSGASVAVECPRGSEREGDRCVAHEVHCPTGARWDGSKCVGLMADPPPEATATSRDPTGEYTGEITVNGRSTRVDTRLHARGGEIVGEYVYGPQRAEGRLSRCRLSGAQLTCRWTEEDLSGTFSVELAPDDRSFSGVWDFSDGRPGGTWTGRQGGAVVPEPTTSATPPPPPPGTLGGNYRGQISVGGRPGPVVTQIDASRGQLIGRYEYGGNVGQLSSCRFVAPRLSCTWTEGGLTGGFQVDFAPDFGSFNGSWDFSDGRPGGSWTGKR